MNGSCTLITGGLGGGKTAKAVEDGFDVLSRGGWWYTNIEVWADCVRDRLRDRGLVFDPRRLRILSGSMGDFHNQVGRGSADDQVLVTIDESHLEFNSRDWAKTNRDLLNFNTLVRKLDINLVYITQDPANLDKQFRRLVQTLWHCRNMKQFKLLGIIPAPLPFYFRVRYDCSIGAQPVRQDVELQFRSSAWGLYNSDALLGPAAQKFGQLKLCKSSPLKRCKPTMLRKQSWSTPVENPWPETASACLAAFFLFVFYLVR